VTRVYVATKNDGKMRELREIFAGTSFDLETYGDYADVVEGESSYAENAAVKARALRTQLASVGISAAVLGDDSGLEVEALGNRPGVLSARYGGPNATWSERRLGLVGELAATGSSDRSARFVCALHFIDATGGETATLETIAGEIAPEERGEAGFSYDPIFLLPERGVTFAELSAEEKNRISHRARAAAALLAALAEPEPAPSGGN
jgi:XTP/dITP diphosphohydrolase